MTDRELLALMAASMWGSIDPDNCIVLRERLVVESAQSLLDEVDRQLYVAEQVKLGQTYCSVCNTLSGEGGHERHCVYSKAGA